MHELSGRGQEKVVLLSKFKSTASWELDCGDSSTPCLMEKTWQRGRDLEVLALAGWGSLGRGRGLRG